MRALVFAIVIGLIGGGLVHVASLPLLAKISGHTPFERLADAIDVQGFQRIDETGRLAFTDPFAEMAACVVEPGPDPFLIDVASLSDVWSVTLYGADGLVVASLNDRAATRGRVQLVILTDEATRTLARDGAVLPAETFVVNSTGAMMLAVVRAVRRESDLASTALIDVGALRCGPDVFDAAPVPDTPGEDEEERTPPTPQPRPGS